MSVKEHRVEKGDMKVDLSRIKIKGIWKKWEEIVKGEERGERNTVE